MVHVNPGMVIFVFLTFFFVIPNSEGKSMVNICVANCGQCQQMFGEFFQGRACAESCLATAGLSVPDCNVPATLKKFLKRYKPSSSGVVQALDEYIIQEN